MAMHLDHGANADVDFDRGVATDITTTFYLVIWQHNRRNVTSAKCKINSELSCFEFYDTIKTNKPFLHKVMSSEKYN
jgi:hypothetical protein